MKSQEVLKNMLARIDHRGYPAYKELQGMYDFGAYMLSIDHVQGDPFAAPSKVHIEVSGQKAGFPKEYYDTEDKRTAVQDFVLRLFAGEVQNYSFQAKGSGKSGLLSVSRCGQEILSRSACQMDNHTGSVTVRLEIGFPAHGRTIDAKALEKILFGYLPECVKKTLYFSAVPAKELQKAVHLAEDTACLRRQLKEKNLAAFVADGAVLPRQSGVSDRPMRQAFPFQSPKSLRVEMHLPHAGVITGMGIPKGVTLIVGGGYHGKSTLLKALEAGVYNHIAGDGREYTVTDDTAVKVRAEDGRSIHDVDISMFIRNLPNGKDTVYFVTQDASGSTSQAAGVAEAVEAQTKLLLIDEDTSATNFMIRDVLMQRVVHGSQEPIIPFIDRVRELYEKEGISTILVAGSCGSYFHKADLIIQMNRYEPVDITEYAKTQAKEFPLAQSENPTYKKSSHKRCPKASKRADDRVKIKTTGLDTICINKENIDVRYIEQLVDSEQLNALGYMLAYAQKHLFDGKKTLLQITDELYEKIHRDGIESVCGLSYVPAGLALPRKQEFMAVVNRYRG
ncbi:MAG: ABC-ATPase domain-containing protein [Eubacterium sp.]|nr:ABC-ATPase domain-containing protein [Eubacterium sp.]